MSDRHLVRAILIRYKTLSDDGVKVCLLPQQLHILSYCPATVPDGGSPEGRPGMAVVSPLSEISGLSFDSTLLFPLLFLCLVLLLFRSYLFSACWPILLNFFQKIVQYFLLRDRLFLCGSCIVARRSKLVGGICSMLPYDTGICCYAFILYFRIFYCFCPFLFLYFF